MTFTAKNKCFAHSFYTWGVYGFHKENVITFYFPVFYTANAEIKIVERRRKSMLAMNSTLQLNAAAHGPRTFSVKPTDNKHFGVKIEDKKDNPQAQQQPYAQVQQQQHINQTLAENNNQMDSSNEEAYEAPAADLQLADIEEESEEDLLEQQENQPIGENRCDSGFGEPGGSLSNRSSLVSSNSVRLPIETNSPVNEAICECGLPGCDGHGEVIENTNNPPDAVTEHQPTSGNIYILTTAPSHLFTISKKCVFSNHSKPHIQLNPV